VSSQFDSGYKAGADFAQAHLEDEVSVSSGFLLIHRFKVIFPSDIGNDTSSTGRVFVQPNLVAPHPYTSVRSEAVESADSNSPVCVVIITNPAEFIPVQITRCLNVGKLAGSSVDERGTVG
jgi:hypothetical protein